jgi:anti-sigma regulatory factor (Ser/Thr protein kinase)
VESKLENLPKIGEFIDETMRYYGIRNLKDIYAVQLSVDEVCTNIIEHAYSNKTDGLIVIRCGLLGEKFIVNIIDWGEAFDPTKIPKPDIDSGLNERKEGGLGIYFMKKFMDEVKYVRVNDRNLLTITKYIKNENLKVE